MPFLTGTDLFRYRARRLADFILLDAPPRVIAQDLWLTLIAYAEGRWRAFWFCICETWFHYVGIKKNLDSGS